MEMLRNQSIEVMRYNAMLLAISGTFAREHFGARSSANLRQAPKLSQSIMPSAATTQLRRMSSPPGILALTKHACIAPSMLQLNGLTTPLQTHCLDVQYISRAGKNLACLAVSCMVSIHVNGGVKHFDRRSGAGFHHPPRKARALPQNGHHTADLIQVGHGDGSGALTLHVLHCSPMGLTINR